MDGFGEEPQRAGAEPRHELQRDQSDGGADRDEGGAPLRRHARMRDTACPSPARCATGSRGRETGRLQGFCASGIRASGSPTCGPVMCSRGPLDLRPGRRRRTASGVCAVADPRERIRDLRANYKFPRSACSRSIASNRALKLPSPKPCAPWRSITSKKSVGRSLRVPGEDLQQVAVLVPVGEDAEPLQVGEVVLDHTHPGGVPRSTPPASSARARRARATTRPCARCPRTALRCAGRRGRRCSPGTPGSGSCGGPRRAR